MTQIRVDAEKLRQKADELSAAAEHLNSLAEQVYGAAEGAPSYDGQFGPGVQAMGEEARALLASKADRLAVLSADLRARAEAFEAADREWQAAMARIYTQTWPSLNQVQWGTPGKEPPWWLVELIIGMFPFGDAYDILKELFRLITQGETDELILILALVGLAADIGWADLLAPDPADAANAGLALLKGLVRQIPAGPARDAIKEALLRVVRNVDEAPEFFAALHQLVKREEILTALKNNPRALAAVLDAGPETMELLAKNEDVALELLKHGEDAASVLKSADAMRILGRNGPEAVGPLVKAATSDAPQAAIEAVGAALDLRRVGLMTAEADELVGTITRLSTHGSGDRVVIGRFAEGSGYEREALDRGGIYYKTLDGVYDALGRNPELAWATNERFLRNQLEQGVPRIELVGESIEHIERHAVGTARWKEIQFLMETAQEYGYELVGKAWIKP